MMKKGGGNIEHPTRNVHHPKAEEKARGQMVDIGYTTPARMK